MAHNFTGHALTFGGYYPEILPADLGAYGTAIVRNISTPLFHFTEAGQIGVAIGAGGDNILIYDENLGPQFEFPNAPFDGLVFKTPHSAPPIKSVSLTDNGTLLPSDLTLVNHHEIELNLAGVILPADSTGWIEIHAVFGA